MTSAAQKVNFSILGAHPTKGEIKHGSLFSPHSSSLCHIVAWNVHIQAYALGSGCISIPTLCVWMYLSCMLKTLGLNECIQHMYNEQADVVLMLNAFTHRVSMLNELGTM